jgi:hypothetical protein
LDKSLNSAVSEINDVKAIVEYFEAKIENCPLFPEFLR